MLISELFHSIQGEGELTGVSSVFVRTSGCNLRCSWCDTKYASWDPEGETMSVDAILEKVDAWPASHCVLTGGEPMVAKDIHELAARLRASGKHLTIETAGTVAPDGIACDLASVSPKLAHSTPAPGSVADGWIQRHEEQRLNLGVLRQWIAHYPYQLKFVVTSERDLDEIRGLIARLEMDIPPSRILLMPEGVDRGELRNRSEMVLKACLQYGYRFCARLQIELFGNTKGT